MPRRALVSSFSSLLLLVALPVPARAQLDLLAEAPRLGRPEVIVLTLEHDQLPSGRHLRRIAVAVDHPSAAPSDLADTMFETLDRLR